MSEKEQLIKQIKELQAKGAHHMKLKPLWNKLHKLEDPYGDMVREGNEYWGRENRGTRILPY